MRTAHWTGLALGALSGLGLAVGVFLFVAPDTWTPGAVRLDDKLLHVLAFACLAGPGVIALPGRYLWFWLGHMAVLAAGIEWVQANTGFGRSGDVADILADLAGLALAFLAGRWIRRRLGLADEAPNGPEAGPPVQRNT